MLVRSKFVTEIGPHHETLTTEVPESRAGRCFCGTVCKRFVDDILTAPPGRSTIPAALV